MDISFSERFQNVITITDALVAAGQDAAEARTQARGLEEEIFKTAESNEDYKQLLEKIISSFQPSIIENTRPVVSADKDEILNPEGPTVGSYSYATFHADGQMSTIFKAKAEDEKASERIVALKITHPSIMTAPHNSIREARMLLHARHESIVPLLESFNESGGRFVLVFPFLRQDLENLLRTDSLTHKQRALVFTGLFTALSHLHSLGMIHRDVKPSNILLRSMEGPAYLIDFGIAWLETDPDSESPTAKITDVGTSCYRPPELLFGCRDYDTSLDMWAAGCVVAEMTKTDHYPIFDAGPLGSELGLIKSQFSILGTPNDESWPSAADYPDWGKMRFQQFPTKPWSEILPGASKTAMEFVSQTVCFEPRQRLTAAQALEHGLAREFSHM